MPDANVSASQEFTRSVHWSMFGCDTGSLNPVIGATIAGDGSVVQNGTDSATYTAPTTAGDYAATLTCDNDDGTVEIQNFTVTVIDPVTMPIGIPQPPSDIYNVQVDIYDGEPGYSTSAQGPYTHYVDSTAGNCSDAGNGTVATPRCTLPASLAAGDVLEVHNGPISVPATDIDIALNGTSSQPTFMRCFPGAFDSFDGGGTITTAHVLFVDGDYYVFEGCTLNNGATIRTGSSTGGAGATVDSIHIRDITINAGARNCLALGGTNIIVSDSTFSRCIWDGGLDAHGIQIGGAAKEVWILNNELAYNAGNGVQWGNFQVEPATAEEKPDLIYLGFNTFRGNAEASASKWGNREIVSENTFINISGCTTNTEWDSASNGDPTPFQTTPVESCTQGDAFIVGADGNPTDNWFIWNTIYGGQNCYKVEDVARYVYLGNVCYDMKQRLAAPPSSGVYHEKNITEYGYIAHNTFYKVGGNGGMWWGTQGNRDSVGINIQNNIWLDGNDEGAFDFIRKNSAMPAANLEQYDNNITYDGAGVALDWQWGSTQTPATSAADYEAVIATADGNIFADPLFTTESTDPLTADFTPQAGSSAVNAATDIIDTIQTEYQATFTEPEFSTLSIIPQEACWTTAGSRDIGAVCRP